MKARRPAGPSRRRWHPGGPGASRGTALRRVKGPIVALAAAAALPLSLAAQDGPGEALPGDRSEGWTIAAAVLAAPASLRSDAEVRAWTADDRLVTLRPGSNGLICLADRPDREGFHAACYAESLEPFMARGRELSRQGVPAAARNETRWREIEAGTLPMPKMGAVYNLRFADADFDPGSVDPATGSRLHALYVSGATAASTGLPVRPGDGPWLMLAGTPSAHVMISLPARRSAGGGAEEPNPGGSAR